MEMHNLISKLIVYRNMDEPILTNLSAIFKEFESGNYDKDELIADIYSQINNLLGLATTYGFNDNLWHNYLSYILATTENPFTLVSEKVGKKEGSVNQFVKHDFKIFLKLFNYDFGRIEEELNIDSFSIISKYDAVIKK